MQQAVILAAGEGWRLRPYTVNRPKVMLPVAGKPVLGYVVGALAENGIREIIMVVGYKKEQVFDYIGSGERFGADVTYVTQSKRLGTANALAQVRDKARDEFLVLSGDKLIGAATIAGFVKVSPHSILVKRVEGPERYGVVNIEGGLVKKLEEQPREPLSNTASTRIYAFSSEIFEFIEEELNLTDVLNKMIERGKSIRAVETSGSWLEAVYPWDILSLNSAVIPDVGSATAGTIEKGVSLAGHISLGKDTVIRANSSLAGPLVIGEGCDIGPNACIMPATSIGDNAIINPFTEIKNSVIGSDTSIGSGSIIHDSVIGNGCSIGGHFNALSGESDIRIDNRYHTIRLGAMIGEDCSIGAGVVAEPGVIMGNYSEVQALKVIRGRFPDKSLIY